MLSGETAAGMYPIEAVKVMSRICREAEASLDYGEIFKTIISDAPMPMSPLESLASSAVRTANKVRARRGTRTGDGTWDNPTGIVNAMMRDSWWWLMVLGSFFQLLQGVLSRFS